ncbi:DNA topoisomerase 3-beta-1 [Geodia barretti]|uniref:DNA topoisomerase n=1 Tax=Geodia barretti TaxID=519541 RepID=A0AA35QV81_GEOBA|nr:DNA topoisomerase 3-beta-1 [Geodia barretti]
MVVVLMVAEKPSLARSLAEILSKKQCRRRKSDCSACDVYEFEGIFPPGGGGVRVTFKMTSVCGHVMSLDFQPQYNKWEQIDPVDLFDAETMKKESMPNLRIPHFLRNEGKGVDYLVLWLDCDKEGENICFEVMEEVEPVMRHQRIPSTQAVYRARFSSITESAILKAFGALGLPDWNESRSVDARMELDLRIGCAFTRFQTMTFQTKYAGLNSSVISYGPCQTPTLGFCVQRHDEILQFKSEKYWKLAAKISRGGRGGPVVSLDWGREGLFDKEVTLLFLARVQDCREAVVVGVAEKPRSKAPPIALHTVELLRAASSKLHIGPKLAMDYAERLYTEGYISYPRTETTKYPKDFDFRSILSSLSGHPEFGEHASSILRTSIKPPSGGVDVGDHPPITPMRSASRDQLRDSEWKIYDFVARHFLATLMPECKYKLTEVEISIGSEVFHWSGTTPTSPGFTAVYPWQEVHGMETSVEWNKDQHWNVDQMKLSEHETTPPGYLTESELITLMEKHRIGTVRLPHITF